MKKRSWTGDEITTLRQMYRDWASNGEIAAALGRSLGSTANKVQSQVAEGLGRGPRPPLPPRPAPKRDRRTLDDAVAELAGDKREWVEQDRGAAATLKATVREPVKTLEDLIRVCEIDTDVWSVDTWTATANQWEAAAKGADGELNARTMFQTKVIAKLVRLQPLDNPKLVLEAVEKGLARIITARKAPRVWVKAPMRVLRQRIITDLHIGGHAWHRGTGGPSWNLEKAIASAYASNAYLDAHENPDATETCIAYLGDLGHYANKIGSTDKGTQLDLDSRADLMIQGVVEFCMDTVLAEAERRPVTVLVLEGNHSPMLDKTLRQVARYLFAKHKGVTVQDQYTARQFLRWHGNLLGFTHGEKATRKLAELMPVEAADLWTGAKLKEYHTGHFHHEAAKQKMHSARQDLFEPTVTHAGVVVRTHMATTPSDQWHADEGYKGAQRGMSDWYYHEAGAMIGSVVASPRVLSAGRARAA